MDSFIHNKKNYTEFHGGRLQLASRNISPARPEEMEEKQFHRLRIVKSEEKRTECVSLSRVSNRELQIKKWKEASRRIE